MILLDSGVALGDAVLFHWKNGAIDLPQERMIFFILYLAFLAADKDVFRGGLQTCTEAVGGGWEEQGCVEAVAGGWEEQGCMQAGTPDSN